MKPDVSIIMPVLNGERYIRTAIESILDQTFRNYELVVIDDGSTDATPAIVASFSERMAIRYVRHAERLGIPRSMNDGVSHASGDFIAFLDHDDTWFPEFLETQRAYLAEHPDVAMVHSDFQTIDGDGNVIEDSVALRRGRSRPSGNVFRELFLDSFVVGNSVLIRRECFTKVGLFDESMRWGDYHMWMRIARHYRVDYVGRVLTRYRQHATQSTRTTVSVSRTNEDSVGLMAVRKILEAYPEAGREIGEAAIRKRLARLYSDLAVSRQSQGALSNARWCYGKAIALSPLEFRNHLLYATTLLKPSRLDAVKTFWRCLRHVFSFRRQPADLEEMRNTAR